jgi:hypothetical protein
MTARSVSSRHPLKGRSGFSGSRPPPKYAGGLFATLANRRRMSIRQRLRPVIVNPRWFSTPCVQRGVLLSPMSLDSRSAWIIMSAPLRETVKI